jgi:hypothetical protein
VAGFSERHLLPLGLWWLALAAPILDLLKSNPEFLEAHGLSGPSAVALLGILALLVPIVTHSPFALFDRLRESRRGYWSELFIAAWLFQWPAVRTLTPALGLLVATLAAALYLGALSVAPKWRTAAAAILLVYAVGQTLAVTLSQGIVLIVTEGWRPPPRASVPVPKSFPIIVWLLDEAPVTTLMKPDGSIDERHFPNFAHLAGTSTWYRVARSEAAETLLAVPPLLTGRAGTKKGGNSLLTIFEDSHDTLVLDQVVALAPPGRLSPARIGQALRDLAVVYPLLLAPQALRDKMPKVDERWIGLGKSEDRYSNALSSLEQLRPSGAKPLFYFRHDLLPHGPFRYRENGRLANATTLSGPTDAKSGASSAFATCFLQFKATDQLLGATIERLKAVGLWQSCLFVLVADHGVTFEEGAASRSTVGDARFDTLYVPLFVKEPGQSHGQTVDQEVSLLDVVPLILDLAGAKPPWPVDGQVPSGQGKASPVLENLKRSAAAKYRRYDLDVDTSVYCDPNSAPWMGEPPPPSSGSAEGISYDLINLGALQNLDLSAPSLPLSIDAKLIWKTPLPAGHLAWVVNGKVTSVIPWNPAASGGELEVASPIPFQALQEGNNPVELYLVAGQRWSKVARLSAPTYRWNRDTLTLSRDQVQVPISEANPKEFLQALKMASGNWKLRLAASISEPTELLLFWSDGGEFQQAYSLSQQTVTLSLPEGRQPDQLTAFVVSGQRARLINWR